MKKITTLLTVILLSLYSFTHAQETKVSFDITLNGDFDPDSIYVVFYPTLQNKGGETFPPPSKIIVSNEKKISSEIYPGPHFLGVMAQGYRALKTPINIPYDENGITYKVKLNSQIIGWRGVNNLNEIKEVSIRGGFNNNQQEGELQMIKKDNVWKCQSKNPNLKKGTIYSFWVNGQETNDHLNKKVMPKYNWLILKNIYTGNELVFDPSLYALGFTESEITTPNPKQQNEFIQMVNEWNPFNDWLQNNLKTIFNLPTDQQKIKIDSIINELTLIINKYDPVNNQLLIEKNISLTGLKFMSLNLPRRTREQSNEDFESQQKEFLLSAPFKQNFKENLNLLQQLDPNSFLLSGDFFRNIIIMQQFVESSPQLSEEFNLPENYFDNFIGDFIENSPNKELCCKLLFEQANMAMRNDEEKARNILMKLQNEYPYEKYGYEDKVNMLLAKMNIKLGKPAPDFTADLLNGGTFSLKDYAGKFVFIDFWGSWCAPCRKEIPNLIKLYDSTSRDKFEIIGLAQDKEPDLRNYIADNNIGYPNALASKKLLAKYGITKYPTSFLINPDGKITRIDVRGEDAMNLLKDEINNYFR